MHKRTRVKICGITNKEDALYAIDLGVDALGFVFCNKSPRNISTQKAESIISSLPAFVTTVALFMDEDKAFVDNVVNNIPVMTLQFHGQESEAFCNQFSLPYIKSIAMGSENNLDNLASNYKSSQCLLLDSNEIGKIGGSGKTFEWQANDYTKSHDFILAGGLNPKNIDLAIKQLKPYAVDVSSGVEASKGVKSKELMRQFMNKIYEVNNDN